jgi:hypothetical protein
MRRVDIDLAIEHVSRWVSGVDGSHQRLGQIVPPIRSFGVIVLRSGKR